MNSKVYKRSSQKITKKALTPRKKNTLHKKKKRIKTSNQKEDTKKQPEDINPQGNTNTITRGDESNEIEKITNVDEQITNQKNPITKD